MEGVFPRSNRLDVRSDNGNSGQVDIWRVLGNYARTALLMSALVGILAIGGRALGGVQGMLLFGGIGLLVNLVSYWFSDRIALMAHHAEEVVPSQMPGLYRMIQRLARRADLPMPRVYVIPSDTPNAFATGRNPEHAAVAVTEGILRILDERELEGVLAHEIAHIKNRDVLIATMAAALAGLIASIGHVFHWGLAFGSASSHDEDEHESGWAQLVWIVVAPLVAMMLQLAISRSREYGADDGGAQLCGDPDALADALYQLEHANQVRPYEFAGPATAHLFIVSPLSSGVTASIMNLLSTHPPVEERIRRLREMRQSV